MLPERTEAFERFISPARSFPQLWRLFLGAVLISLGYLGFSLAVVIGASMFNLKLTAALAGSGTILETYALLFTFFGMSLGVFAAVRIFHKRSPLTLLGPNLFEVRRNFAIGATVIFVVSLVVQAFFVLTQDLIPNLPIVTWLALLPFSMLLVLLQTSAEELVFRGYLQQQLAARFQSRWVWWLLPSIIFGLLHYEPDTFGPNTWLVVADTALFGLVAADVTARTGNLGAAIGLHFVNNAMIFLFIAPIDDINGLALQLSPLATTDVEAMRIALVSDIVLILVLYLVYLRIMQRKDL